MFDESGDVYRRFWLPTEVYGCHWNPNNPNVFACGTGDGMSYVFDVTKSEESSLLHALKGHVDRCFCVKWNPLDLGCLATGSDDCTINVWNLPIGEYREDRVIPLTPPQELYFEKIASFENVVETKFQCLRGHKSNVRPLLWHTEISYLLISGSWDAKILLFDTRHIDPNSKDHIVARTEGSESHLVDVYGLASHPDRPFTLVSTSRDTTVRFWNIRGANHRELMTDTVTCNLEEHITVDEGKGKKALIAGENARQLYRMTNDVNPEEMDASFFAKVWTVFGGDVGIDELWDIVITSVKNDKGGNGGTKQNAFGEGGGGGGGVGAHHVKPQARHIHHTEEIVRHGLGQANELESVKMRRGSVGNSDGVKKEDILVRSAETYAKAGDLRKYCDIMRELGRWERALSVAPAVGYEYVGERAKRARPFEHP